MPETPRSPEEQDFVASPTNEETKDADINNMNHEQRHASYVREKAYQVYGQEMPSLEFRSQGFNQGDLQGTVKGVELSLSQRRFDKLGKPLVETPATIGDDEHFEYTGTMNGQPLKPQDAERLFQRYAQSPSKKYIEKATKEAAESIQPKEKSVDAYEQTLNTLLGDTGPENNN